MSELNIKSSIHKNDNFEKCGESCANEKKHTPSEWQTNIFCIYSKVFKIMLANWRESIDHAEEKELSKGLDELVLPSNEEWRHHVYYRLVDLQREIDSRGVEGVEE